MSFIEQILGTKPFSNIVMGNHALVRAMVESRVRVVTSYPGSPTPEIADAIKAIPADNRPFYFEFSTNEKVATEVAFGASINGHFSTVFFKSVGLNVAADAFVQLSHMKLKGGMVVVIGEDPGANSSQNEQDNRHLAYLSHTPVFEPANGQEVYEMYLQAARLSKQLEMPIILRMSTHVCHAKARVQFGEYQPDNSTREPEFDPDSYNYLPITSLVYPMKKRALQNLQQVRELCEDLQENFTIDNKNKERGVITFGLTFLSFLDVLAATKMQKPDILKLGMVYPLPRRKLVDFLKNHEEVKILEELDSILEKEIKTVAFEEKIEVKLIGKVELEDYLGEYTPEKVEKIISRDWPDQLEKSQKISEVSIEPPARPAQMCPGCGHRSAFFAIKKALNENDITVADIGCHTLGFLPPYKMGQVLLCMGASIGIGSGLSLFNKQRKVVAFMGDSTFFHAGSAGAINAVFNKHNLTLIIMDNGTTAMTGHQNHAGSGQNFNNSAPKLSIAEIFKTWGVKVREVDTYAQGKLTALVEESLAETGFNVVIAKHPCMLQFTRKQKKKGVFQPNQVEVTDKCNLQYVCVSEFGCPSFTVDSEGEVSVNRDLCIGDGSCLQTCPVGAVGYPVKGDK